MKDFNYTSKAAYLNECLGENFFKDIESTSDNNPTFLNTIHPELKPIDDIAPSPLEKSTSRKKRLRTCYTTQQLNVFESIFREKEYLTLNEKDRLAAYLNLPRRNIKIWFQNRRQKKKRANNKKQVSELPILDEKAVELVLKDWQSQPNENDNINIDYLEIFNNKEQESDGLPFLLNGKEVENFLNSLEVEPNENSTSLESYLEIFNT